MKKFAMAVVGCAAAVSSAAPFRALSYEAGGGLPGIAGAGFSVNFGGFFTSAAAGGTNVIGGRATGFTNGNEGDFDSHFSLDGFGPTARDRNFSTTFGSTLTQEFYGDYPSGDISALHYNELQGSVVGVGVFNAPGAAFAIPSGSHVGDPNGDGSAPELRARAGIAITPPPVLSHFAPNVAGGRSTNNGAFVGRFTIKQGATLSGGMYFSTLVASGDFDSHELALGGPAALFRTHNGPQFLSLRAYKINLAAPVFINNPSDATAEGLNEGIEFGHADVYDLWVQVVPGLGGVSLVPVAAIVVARRRERESGGRTCAAGVSRADMA